MDEEVSQPLPKPKQYILMVGDMQMAMLAKIMPGIQYIEIEGMSMEKNEHYMLLVSPLVKKQETQECIPS